MKRALLLATAIVTFFCGVTVSRLFRPTRYPHYQFEHRRCHKREFKPRLGSEFKPRVVSEFKPLRVWVDPVLKPANKRIPYEHSYVSIDNASTIPIRYYVLGFGTDLSNVGASGFMSEKGSTYTYPDLSHGPLMPGETRTIPIKATAKFSEEAWVWVDYLEFEDGLAWGPNKSHTLRVRR
jgi:hypothetical protein